MAIDVKSIKFNKEQLLSFLPLAISIVAIIFLLFVLILPQAQKTSSLSKEIQDTKSSLAMVNRGSLNLKESKNEIAELEKKVAELEKRLPRQVETTLLIDTLKDITEEAKLKFAYIEPLAQKDYEIKGQEEFYTELPIKVKLNCNFSDLINFIRKIEGSSRLMKIKEFSVGIDPQDTWEHKVELTINTFAIGKK